MAVALDHKFLHDLNHPGEVTLVAAIDGFLIESALARLERCVAVEIPRIGAAGHYPVVVPHRSVGVYD